MVCVLGGTVIKSYFTESRENAELWKQANVLFMKVGNVLPMKAGNVLVLHASMQAG